jgi:ribonuclease G
MGGIIVVDFIDLRKPDNKRLVYEHLVKEMEKDRAKHTVLPMSKFGLIQITRQRVRPEMNIVTTETCPSCNGTGKIMPSILIVDEIENNIDYLIRKIKASSISLYVHPFIEAFLKSGWPSHRMKWFFKYKKWIPVKTDSSLPLTSVKYYNASGEELKFE